MRQRRGSAWHTQQQEEEKDAHWRRAHGTRAGRERSGEGRRQHRAADAFFRAARTFRRLTERNGDEQTETRRWRRRRKRRKTGNNAPLFVVADLRDLNRVPPCSSLLRMLRNGGMDYTREAPGGCCPAALYYDRKVRLKKEKKMQNRRRTAAASRIVFSMAPSPPFLSCASRIFRSMVPSPSCSCVVDFFSLLLFHRSPYSPTTTTTPPITHLFLLPTL